MFVVGKDNFNFGEFKVCMVFDFVGFNDKFFNEIFFQGFNKVVSDFGVKIVKVELKDDKDYVINLQFMVDVKCLIIVFVGFLFEKFIFVVVKVNLNVKFVIVDDNLVNFFENFKLLIFNIVQFFFEVGYLVFVLIKIGKVVIFGGMKILIVIIFMDGFFQGVDYYNKQKYKLVQVIGWDVKKQDGQFVLQFNLFQNVFGGKVIV